MSESFFQHAQAIIESDKIGAGTRIWAFSHVCPQVVIGRDCNICEHTFLEDGVKLGDRVTIKCGVFLWKGVEIQDDVFVGPNATFTNDKFPRSKHWLGHPLVTVVERGASIGAGAVILPGLRIGEGAMVGAGSVVTRNVPPFAVVQGNPARICGYADSDRLDSTHKKSITDDPALFTRGEFQVKGIRLVSLKSIRDLRGDLSVGQVSQEIPFPVQRYFLISKVPSKEIRGEHAHRVCRQFLVCLQGSVSILADDGIKRSQLVLKSSTMGLLVEEMVWTVQFQYTSDAILLVLASHDYDAADYIRSYEEFRNLVLNNPSE